MTEFLAEDEDLSLDWEEIKELPFHGEGAMIAVPWFRDGNRLYCQDPDGLAIAMDASRGVVLMTRGSDPLTAALKLDGSSGWSEHIQALTPERAMAIARQLAVMASKCRSIREGEVGAED